MTLLGSFGALLTHAESQRAAALLKGAAIVLGVSTRPMRAATSFHYGAPRPPDCYRRLAAAEKRGSDSESRFRNRGSRQYCCHEAIAVIDTVARVLLAQ